jgi:hypothetical protein
MKRLLAVLVILALAAGTVAAQDAPALKFSGSVQTGFNYRFLDSADFNEDNHGYANSWHDDADNFRARLLGVYEEEFYGVQFGLQGSYNKWYSITGEWLYKVMNQGSSDEPPAQDWRFSLYDTRGWIKPLKSDLLTITAGQTSDEWGSGGKLDSGTGDADIRLSLRPIPGLVAGVTFGDRQFYKPERARLVEDYFKETAVGLKYSLSDGGVVIAAGYRSNDGAWDDTDKRAYLGFLTDLGKLGVLPGLKVDGGARVNALHVFQDKGVLREFLRVEYENGPLYANLAFSGWQGMADNQAFGWRIETEPSYKILDPLKAILYFGIHNNWDASAATKDKLIFEISPRLQYTLNIGKAEVITWYDFAFINNGYVDKNRMVHEINVRFNWNF